MIHKWNDLSFNHRTFLTCSEMEKEQYVQAQKEETIQRELQAGPRDLLDPSHPQRFPEGKESQGFSLNTFEENALSKLTSRRALLAASALAAIGMTGCAASTTKSTRAANPTKTIETNNTPTTSKSPLQKLLDGNLRFQRGQAKWPNQTIAQRRAVAQKQTPFALIFGCVDSRVPPELVFDQGLGDLLVVRTAAHVIDNAALGSIEFGVAELGIPLLVILGHERCGAVAAAIQAIDHQQAAHGSIQSLVEYIHPSVLKAQGQGDARLTSAIHNNIIYTLHMLSQSKIISDAANTGKLTIVGSYYDLDTGAVSLLTNQ
jgi:carbonic anhydrase